jgi:hypothetical protein
MARDQSSIGSTSRICAYAEMTTSGLRGQLSPFSKRAIADWSMSAAAA